MIAFFGMKTYLRIEIGKLFAQKTWM